MGRWTDKPYIAQSEWSNAHGDEGLALGGKKTNIQGKKETTESLAFDCCMLSLRPFTKPMCTADGYVFDADVITAYVNEHHKHPFTGEALDIGDLTELVYHQNASGDYVDPVSFKQFTEFTKIVANRRSGQVYSWTSVEEFNIKINVWDDLVTGDPFERSDLVVLRDPSAPKVIAVRDKGKLADTHAEESRQTIADKTAPSVAGSVTTKQAAKLTAFVGNPSQPYNAASYSKGLAAASFTSTSMAPVTTNEADLVSSEDYMFARIKAKGYVRLVTNMGDINLELHCDLAPRTCYNFIKLAQSGYYKGTKFHRSIKNFMLQGGDPTATGRGGKSYWGSDFRDEISKKLSHSERGILSMANRGPHTNSSQFFILYRAAKHLDGKHTIFGRVVGGLPVLSQIESVSTDDGDRPERDIVISDVSVFVDPFTEFSKRLERKLEHERESQALGAGKRQRTIAEEEQHERETTTWFGTKIASAAGATESNSGTDAGRGGERDKNPTARVVGKYLKKPRLDSPKPTASVSGDANTGKTKPKSGQKFGDFADW
ncbi:cyclophilin peptidyl-prolyl cis-trans isomerase Cyp8 [Coemansia spiralis]|uniref:Cyclophilin peptidyl-prolyl cis-trans isomerase Cyp8 n=1 Tax=Coemansia spiralis TaxID=417178 RepID=A0A9W8L466_9FUNG|nr:cyclophilin peptidyl-prolyl cis-trans isomerase Cyp8 [Coemansia spiralis]